MRPLLLSFFLLVSLPVAIPAQTIDSLLLLSIRKGYSNSKQMAGEIRVEWARLEGEEPPIFSGELTENELSGSVKDKRVLLIIHGMGVSFQKALQHYRRVMQWGAGEPFPYDIALGFVWPGYELNGTGFRFGTVFVRANPRSKRSGKELAPILEAIAANAGSLDIMAHSMGTKVALFALRQQPETVGHLFLMAPSIPAHDFKPGHRFQFAGEKVSEAVVVLHSRNDPAFRAFGTRKMGYMGLSGMPPGLETKFINIDCSEAIHGHSYWYYDATYEAIGSFLD